MARHPNLADRFSWSAKSSPKGQSLGSNAHLYTDSRDLVLEVSSDSVAGGPVAAGGVSVFEFALVSSRSPC